MSKLTNQSRIARHRRRDRVRKKVSGTSEKPRLQVYRSLSHIYAQVIDDVNGKTLFSASSLRMELPVAGEPVADDSKEKGKKGKKEKPATTKMRRSIAVGSKIAELAKEKGIEKVVFDRGGFLYHGRVAALADAARKGGLKF